MSGMYTGPLAGVLHCCSANHSLNGAPWVWSYSVVQCLRHLMGQPLYRSAANAGMWGEAMVMAPALCVTQQYSLVSMAAWISSTGISHYKLLPYISSIHLSAVNISPCPEIAPHFLNSSSHIIHSYLWLTISHKLEFPSSPWVDKYLRLNTP